MSESLIRERVHGRTRFVKNTENVVVGTGATVSTGAGLLLMGGLLSPLDAGLTIGTTLTLSALAKLALRSYRKGSEKALGSWEGEAPVIPLN